MIVTVQMSLSFFKIIVIYGYFFFFRNKQVDEDGWKVVVVVVLVDHVAAVMGGELKRQRSKKKTKEVKYVMAVAIAFDASSSCLEKQPKQVTFQSNFILLINLILVATSPLSLTRTSNFSFFWYRYKTTE